MSLLDIINRTPVIYTLVGGVTITEHNGLYEVRKYDDLIGTYSSLRKAIDSL